MSLESETDDGGSWRWFTTPPPSIYFGPHTGTVTSSANVAVTPYANVTFTSSENVTVTTVFGDVSVVRPPMQPLHVEFSDLGPLYPRFKLSVGQTGEIGPRVEAADWLAEALEELEEAPAEAEEEGYEPVTELIVENARKLLNDLARRVVHSPIVQSMPEGGIAIEFRNPEKRAGVVVVCEPDGEGACFYEVEGRRSRTRCTDINDLLDAAVWYALSEAALT